MEVTRIRVENFMNAIDTEVQLYHKTIIKAKNGVGKSTIANAYMWLMFGCDMDLHDNPMARRLNNGIPADGDVSVTAEFDIDGKIVTARKVQKRTYKKDGSSYSDDNTYYVNEVPKTLKDFNAYFECDIKALLICSNIGAFIGKKDKDMREYLFSKVENITDYDIAARNPALAELVPLLQQYKVEEIEAMKKAGISKAKKDLPVYDGMIAEKERDVALKKAVPVSDLELARNSLKEQIAKEQSLLDDLSAASAEYGKLGTEIMQLKFKLSDLERKANEENVAKERLLQSQVADKSNEILTLERSIASAETKITFEKQEHDKARANVEQEKIKYLDARKREFDENSLVCSYCGQEYPSEKKDALRGEFESHKAEELKLIAVRGSLFSDTAREHDEAVQKLSAEVEETKKKIETLKVERDKLAAEKVDPIDVRSIPEYAELEKLIAEKTKKFDAYDLSKENDHKSLIESLNKELMEVEIKIASSDYSADEDRLAELKGKRLDAEQAMADCEKVLDLLNELAKCKNETLSAEINSRFGLVKWKLFEYAKNGGYKNCCIPTVDGKSILSLESNKANRLIGALDIVNGIQKMERLNCPVFVDDSEAFDTAHLAEATNMMDCQTIFLNGQRGSRPFRRRADPAGRQDRRKQKGIDHPRVSCRRHERLRHDSLGF